MPHRIKKEADGWTIRESWDAETGERSTAYFYKRNRAPRVELKGKLAQQLGAYALIEKDLRSVQIWLQEIEEMHPLDDRSEGVDVGGDRKVFNIVKGLYVASLTFYGKCFTQCEGRRVKLDKKTLEKKFHKAHESVMHMRHNFAAHSGADNFEEVKIALVLHPKRREKAIPKVYRELKQPDLMDASDGEIKFADLARHAQEMVWKKMGKVERAIYDREVLPKGHDYWYTKGRNG